ncbi:MAG: hypothetical protein K8U03_25185 [Planctomycetia bacterium]|nr:hypothetical protein [Planctomycetia bacterium]
MSGNMFVIDDKFIPLYRVLWIGKTPHYCGEEDCMREGYYEVRLEDGESIWGNQEERDGLLEALEIWCGGTDGGEPEGEDWR